MADLAALPVSTGLLDPEVPPAVVRIGLILRASPAQQPAGPLIALSAMALPEWLADQCGPSPFDLLARRESERLERATGMSPASSPGWPSLTAAKWSRRIWLAHLSRAALNTSGSLDRHGPGTMENRSASLSGVPVPACPRCAASSASGDDGHGDSAGSCWRGDYDLGCGAHTDPGGALPAEVDRRNADEVVTADGHLVAAAAPAATR